MPYKDKDAERARRRARYWANIETRRARNRRDSVLFRQRHPEKVHARNYAAYHADIEQSRARNRAAGRKRRQEHPEEVRAYDRSRRAEERPRRLASSRAYYQATRAIRCAVARANRQKHKGDETYHALLLAYYHRYRQLYPEKKQTDSRNRRAQKAATPLNDLTHAQWVEIQEAQDHCCYYCGKRCKGRLTQDHLTPLSQGGAHTLHNVIGACQSCNSRKHTGPPLTPVQPLLLTVAPAKKRRVS